MIAPQVWFIKNDAPQVIKMYSLGALGKVRTPLDTFRAPLIDPRASEGQRTAPQGCPLYKDEGRGPGGAYRGNETFKKFETIEMIGVIRMTEKIGAQ